MSLSETALPPGDTAAAGEQSTPDAAAAQTTELQTEGEGQEQASAESAAEGDKEGGEKPAKPEKTAEQREIDRLRRRVDNLTRRRYELEARAGQQQEQRPAGQQGTQSNDDEPVTLSRAELQKLITEQAQGLAPAINEQQAQIEQRTKVVQSLEKQWGKEEFNAKAADLDDVLGGLMDRSGKPKPATDAIFESDNPKGVIEYLTDPDNAEEAERISRLPAVRAGREIARIEVKLAEAKKQAQPAKSSAARPIEPLKGGGAPKGMPDPSDTKAWIKYQNEREHARR